MNPSRELDALVAEKVMGWHWSEKEVRTPDPDGWSIRKVLVPPNADWVLTEYDKSPGMNSVEFRIPSYPTSIEAAWEVVIRVPQINSVFKYATPMWACSYGNDEKSYETALTAPHAICLAALKAVGYEIKD